MYIFGLKLLIYSQRKLISVRYVHPVEGVVPSDTKNIIQFKCDLMTSLTTFKSARLKMTTRLLVGDTWVDFVCQTALVAARHRCGVLLDVPHSSCVWMMRLFGGRKFVKSGIIGAFSQPEFGRLRENPPAQSAGCKIFCFHANYLHKQNNIRRLKGL